MTSPPSDGVGPRRRFASAPDAWPLRGSRRPFVAGSSLAHSPTAGFERTAARSPPLDVLIVGAGISGVSAAVHLRKALPHASFVIIEQRRRAGGTWDLFRYPGVRSDSDMYTLGFRFKPWTNPRAIADGPSIRAYIEEAIQEHDLTNNITFGRRVTRAEWSTDDAYWTVRLAHGSASTDEATDPTDPTDAGAPTDPADTLRARFLFMCGGYYDYDRGFLPDFPGYESFAGTVIHPQQWPESLDYQGKRVVVIGSGATAVTLVPALADTGAAHVTMLQRSPSFVASRPSTDRFATMAQRLLPSRTAYALVRWKNATQGTLLYNLARKKPDVLRQKLLDLVTKELKPGFDVATHFTPRYNPWDQRLCLVPDSDLFVAINDGRASIVTDTIAEFTANGITTSSGAVLAADIIVTATGLNLQLLGGAEFFVDGTPIAPGETVMHRGVMLSDIPNLAMWFGYTNASWTLKADLTSEYMCRVLKHMEFTNTTIVTPSAPCSSALEPFVDFSSGYFARAQQMLPKQGVSAPWRLNQNYFRDVRTLRYGRVDDETLTFARSPVHTVAPVATSAP